MRRSGIPIPPPVAKAQAKKIGTATAKAPAEAVPYYPIQHSLYHDSALVILDDSAPGASFTAGVLVDSTTSALDTYQGAFGVDTDHPVHKDVASTQAQRMAYYEMLARAIGPAEGFQECVGTYRSYMAEQTKIYYERILPPCRPNSKTYPASPSSYLSHTLPTGNRRSSRPAGHSHSSYDTHTAVLGSWDRNSLNRDRDAILELSDILVSPVLASAQPARPRTVSFATHASQRYFFSSMFVPQPASVFDPSSSSLAGALGDLPPPAATEHDGRRTKGREWNRPQMGRARAYSAGGGI